MIGPGAGLAQNARAAPGIGEPAPHGLGEIRRTDIMRARREEQDAARRGYLCGEPRQLAVAAQRRPHIALRARKGRRVGDDDVKALAGCGERGCLGKYLSAAEGAALGDIVAPRCALSERQGGLGAVDADHRRGGRAGLSSRSAIAAGLITCCNASSTSGISRSMPAVLACTTSTEPNRSMTRPGSPSASAWISR